MLILKPFNLVFFASLAIFVGLFLLAWFLTKNKSEKVRGNTLAIAFCVTFVIFWIYKVFLSLDTEYSEITAAAGNGAFSWWSELPLQLCNINLMLIPLGIWTKKRPILSFAFFMAPLGAILALSMPSVGFYDCSVLLPRMLGYYITHFMVLLGGPALALFGLYRPKFRDFPITVLAAFCILLVIFGINSLMRATGVNPYANYFYCSDTDDNPLLELFYKFIPIPFLYMMPGIFIMVPYMALVTLPFYLYDKKKASASVKSAEEEMDPAAL